MSVPAAVALAATLAARDHEGIVGYHVHRTGVIAAGPYHRRDDVTLVVVFQNDRMIGLRVLRDVVNDRSESETQRAQLEKHLSAGSKDAGFAVPFDARHFNEYRYSVDGRRVKFDSDRKDAHHGNGYFELSPAGAVTQLHYTPEVLPRYALSGDVQESRAEVLPGFWATIQSTESYAGRYLIFSGSGQFVTQSSDFQRFSNLEAAKRWLQAER